MDLSLKEVDTNEMSEVELMQYEFNTYILNSKISEDQKSINELVKMDELNDIKETIIESSIFLETFSKGDDKSWKNKLKDRMSTIPYIGNSIKNEIIKQEKINMLDKSVNEVLEGMFEKFEEKQDKLIRLSEELYRLENRMVSDSENIYKYLMKLEEIIHEESTIEPERLKAIKLSGTAQSYRLGLEENIHNKISFINMFIRDIMDKMNIMLPMIKSGMEDDISLSAITNMINETSEMFSHVIDLSKRIKRNSNEELQSSILKVSNSILQTGVDKEDHQNGSQRNIKFHNMMKEQNKKIAKKYIEDYNYLIDSSQKMEQQALENDKETAQIIKQSALKMLEIKEEKNIENRG